MFALIAVFAIVMSQPLVLPHNEQGDRHPIPRSGEPLLPGICGEKPDGLSIWHNDQMAIDEDDSGAWSVISSTWPNFSTNRLGFWGFPSESTTAEASVYIRLRQYPLNGGVYDMYGVFEVSQGNEHLQLWPDESQNIPPDDEWIVLQYPIGKAYADWSSVTIDWHAVSGLLNSAICEVDCIWVQ